VACSTTLRQINIDAAEHGGFLGALQEVALTG
jgi:hypothetical protein